MYSNIDDVSLNKIIDNAVKDSQDINIDLFIENGLELKDINETIKRGECDN